MLRNLSSIVSMFKTDLLGAVIYIIMFAMALLISLILHEIGHGYMALRCGDPTAKMMRRLSLNPLDHLDPIGTLCMVLLGFGWAKPVPVNPRNFVHYPWQSAKKSENDRLYGDAKQRARIYRTDNILVSVAGITINLLLFLLCLALSVLVLYFMAGKDFALLVRYTDTGSVLNLKMADAASRQNIYWLFVGHQLSGLSQSELTSYMAISWLQYPMQFLSLMCSFNIALALFNLIPVPPLDGYRLLNDIAFRGRLHIPAQFMRYAQIGLMALCWFGLLNGLLSTCIDGVYGFFLRMFLSLIPA